MAEIPSQSAIKKWHEQIDAYVRAHGPVVGHGPAHHHHPKGRTYKHNKILVGPWWVIPVAVQYHDISYVHDLNVTFYPKRFTDAFGLQSVLWRQMLSVMIEDGMKLPFEEDVINAVLDTRQ